MVIPSRFNLAEFVNDIVFRPYPRDNPTHQCWPNWDNDYTWPEKYQDLYEYYIHTSSRCKRKFDDSPLLFVNFSDECNDYIRDHFDHLFPG